MLAEWREPFSAGMPSFLGYHDAVAAVAACYSDRSDPGYSAEPAAARVAENDSVIETSRLVGRSPR